MQRTVLVGVLLVWLPLCAGDDASRTLLQLQKEFLDWRMADRPGQARRYNIHKYDDQVENLDMSMFDTRKAKADQLYLKLRAVDRSELKRMERINYDILEDSLKTLIDGYKWRFYQYLSPASIMTGPQYDGQSFSQQRFYTHGDFLNGIIRLEQAPTTYELMIVMMREAIRLNRTNNEWSMKTLEGQFLSSNVSNPDDSYFFVPFKEQLDLASISDADREWLRSRARRAVRGAVDGLMKIWTFLKQEYIPNTRPQEGIGSLTNGQEYYQALIKWYLSEDMTAQQVHDIGLKEVQRIASNMKKIIKQQGFDGTIREYFDSLLQNPAFAFKTKEEVLDAYRAIIKIIEKEVPKYVNNVPDLPLVVRATPFDSGIAFYQPGAVDGSSPGVFYVNNFKPSHVSNFTMMAIALHEATPGHHTQISFSVLADIPDFRRKREASYLNRAPFAFGSYTAYIEGWGLYAEALGEEMGVYRDANELMGRYSLEMLRACRLVVDTGIHALGWPRDRAVDYLKTYTAVPLSSINYEVNRYISIPGQALAYKIGEMKIFQIRRKAESKLGEKFNLGAFHAVVLEHGTIPLSILERLVDEWIDDVLADQSPATCTSSCVQISFWALALILLRTVN